MKTKLWLYWVCTGLLAFVFLPGGIFQVMRIPQTVEGFTRLGFPLYFVTFLGVWKILGAIALLVPGMALVKEWAYAGMVFDLTGAAVASAATGGAWWHVLAPLVVLAILIGSWWLRPADRRLPPEPKRARATR